MLRPEDFVYDLPPERIAQRPSEPRDACRLLRLVRATGGIEHRQFTDLPELLRPGDLLVLNDTRVLPAKFPARRRSGAQMEGLFLREREGGDWAVLLKNARRCRPGERLVLGDGQHELELVADEGQGEWVVRPVPACPAEELLGRIGSTPLPPYIRRPGPLSDEQDSQRYQTVFARRPGSVAAPTAGLHFTDRLLAALAARGVERTAVTLHVGLGTFLPVKADTLQGHKMHSEWFDLPASAVEAIRRARQRGGRVVAVGTTAVRVLESVAARGPLQPTSGWTKLFLYPPAPFGLTDALITNFHLPASTLLMLVAAFCDPGGTRGRALILDAYRQAVEQQYAFFSYGDAMLIE